MALLEKEVSAGTGGMRRCPAERCNYTFAFEMGNSTEGHKFDCPSCSARFCLGCGANGGRVGPAHAGPCSTRLRQLQESAREKAKLEAWRRENAQADARFRELIAREAREGTTKSCPKCRTAVTKNAGCDHMTCRCGHQFYWTTLRPYP